MEDLMALLLDQFVATLMPEYGEDDLDTLAQPTLLLRAAPRPIVLHFCRADASLLMQIPTLTSPLFVDLTRPLLGFTTTVLANGERAKAHVGPLFAMLGSTVRRAAELAAALEACIPAGPDAHTPLQDCKLLPHTTDSGTGSPDSSFVSDSSSAASHAKAEPGAAGPTARWAEQRTVAYLRGRADSITPDLTLQLEEYGTRQALPLLVCHVLSQS